MMEDEMLLANAGIPRTRTRIRMIAACLVASAAIAAALMAPAAACAAAGPDSAPAVIQQTGFEEASTASYTVAALPGVQPAPAWWGRTSHAFRGGAWGMWCAGSSATAWNEYPSFSKGLVTFALPQLANYYSADLNFWYNVPTLGAGDGDSFGVDWLGATDNPLHPDSHFGPSVFPLTGATEWRQADFSLVPTQTGRLNLSRRAGTVEFQWYDNMEDFGQLPLRGQGVTLDDVSIIGYALGPVGSLGHIENGAGVHLSWAHPARAVGSTTPEERAIVYRVWRRASGGVWTEITGSPTVSESIIDSLGAEAAGTQFEYAVQARLASGDGYGQASTWSRVGPRAATTLSLVSPTATSTISAYAGPVTITVSLSASASGTGIDGKSAGLLLQQSENGLTWTSSSVAAIAKAGTAGGYTFTVRPTVKTYYRARFAGDGGYDPAATPDSAVRYVLPRASLGTPSAPSPVTHGRAFTVSGSLAPKHATGSVAVSLRFERKVSGRWRLWKTVSAKIASTGRYSARVTLPYAGAWHVQAYHADAGHAPTWSGYRAMTAR
jgi:hypothetical protein